MAIVLPVLLVVVFGTLGASQLMYFRKSLVAAASEGVRLASQRDSTAAEVQARVNAVLASRRINDATVTTIPEQVEASEPGDVIDVQIQANFRGFGFGVFGDGAAIPVTVRSSILRE